MYQGSVAYAFSNWGEGIPPWRFNVPTGLAVDNRAEGGVYVADTENHCIRKVSFGGTTHPSLGMPDVPGTMLDDETPFGDDIRDLCAQGVSCLIADKGDFGSGTSAAPSRLIHGGLKYLETGEFGLVAQSTLERNLLLKNAPHFVPRND